MKHNMHDMHNMPDQGGEGREQQMMDHAAHMSEGGGPHKGHDHHMAGGNHHAMMVADFRRRFWISLIISIPILLLSPLIQRFIGLEGKIDFTGDSYVLWAA